MNLKNNNNTNLNVDENIKIDIENKNIFNYSDEEIKILFLGGAGECGSRNCTAYIYKGKMYIIDMGLGFLSKNNELLGGQYILPDIHFINRHIDKLDSIIITHAHTDHIGGLFFFLNYVKRKIKIYASGFVKRLLSNKLKKFKLVDKLLKANIDNIFVINNGKKFFVHEELSFLPIYLTHSIPENFSYFITTPKNKIYHTGDYKIDLFPNNMPIDFNKLVKNSNNVDLMITDSTRVQKNSFSDTGKSILKTFKDLLSKHAQQRIFVALFSSHVDRIIDLIRLAFSFNRKVLISGTSMKQYFNSIKKNRLGFTNTQLKNIFFYLKKIDPADRNKLFIITSGCQAENNTKFVKSLYEFDKNNLVDNSNKLDKKLFRIFPNDVVIFSANIIPGNESEMFSLLNHLIKNNITVYHKFLNDKYNLHVSGHGYKIDSQILLKLIKPKFLAPVHGENFHIYFQKKAAIEVGFKSDNIFLNNNSDMLVLNSNSKIINNRISTIVKKTKVFAYEDFILDKNSSQISKSTLMDRQTILFNGMITIFYVFNKKFKVISSYLQFISSSFIEIENFLKKIKNSFFNSIYEIKKKLIEFINKTFSHKIPFFSEKNYPLIKFIELDKNML